MPEAARAVRRRTPLTLKKRAEVSARRRDLQDALATWLPPGIAAAALLVLYFLGHLDVIDTPPALAIDAFLLLAIVLYFPMRYARRLEGRGRVAAALFAVAWLAAVYYPIYRRIYPAQRLASIDASADILPITLATAGHGTLLDVVIDGHLEPTEPGGARAATYSVTLAADGLPPQRVSGEFTEAWDRQRQGRTDAVDVLNERKSRLATIENPSDGDVRVTALSVSGQAAPVLTISAYRHAMPPWWIAFGGAALLLFGAVAFDRATAAGETAASMAVATGTAVTGALAFPSIGSPHPTFRELAGAAIVGGLVGGPIGVLVGWRWRRGVGHAQRTRARGR